MKMIRDWLVYSIGITIIVLMLWDVLFSEHGYFVFKQEKEQQQQIADEIVSLKAEQARLNAEIIRLRDDPRALEEVIHRELGYVFPDEFMLIMPDVTQDKDENKDEIKGE